MEKTGRPQRGNTGPHDDFPTLYVTEAHSTRKTGQATDSLQSHSSKHCCFLIIDSGDTALAGPRNRSLHRWSHVTIIKARHVQNISHHGKCSRVSQLGKWSKLCLHKLGMSKPGRSPKSRSSRPCKRVMSPHWIDSNSVHWVSALALAVNLLTTMDHYMYCCSPHHW